MGEAAALDRLMFDPFRFSERVRETTADCPLLAAGRHIFKAHDLPQHFDLDLDALDTFLRVIESSMPQNPYHNRTHVLDVLQSVHALLLTDRLARLVPPEMKLACLIAACVHDVEHRGLSNDFLIKVHDSWAEDAQDAGANEVHHAKVGLSLLARDGCQVLRRLDTAVADQVLDTVRHLVLDTDMKRHAHTVEDLAALARTGPLEAPQAQGESLLVVLSGIIKVADLGHSWTLNAVHMHWVRNLEDEFFKMGDMEKARGLPVSMMCDRSAPGLRDGQVGFFDHVLLPLFTAFADVIPECAAVPYQAKQNRDAWVKPTPGKDVEWTPGMTAVGVAAVGAALVALLAMKRR